MQTELCLDSINALTVLHMCVLNIIAIRYTSILCRSTRLTREGVARHGGKRDGDGGGKSKDLLQTAERTLAMEIYDTQNKALAV